MLRPSNYGCIIAQLSSPHVTSWQYCFLDTLGQYDMAELTATQALRLVHTRVWLISAGVLIFSLMSDLISAIPGIR